ncbi:Von Hippel-Lindau disease tumor suppressor [Papilio xuthus]|uniref:von Hippel-Lindau disease tumor suppressor n=1 Tax=Papilio xuthus TaxID=66420 RepID=A0A194QBV0_PAPXU|nr:Von Hippel-Lindau disease tumor suppressor [Papilio xuthus]
MPEAGNGDLIYEINQSGERVLVRSIESVRTAYLRFTNRSSRPIDVWWRDFNGAKQHFVKLEPGTYYDVNTYLTHPWEFTDVTTKERYVINNNPIFRAPANVGGMRYRTNWNITVGVRSLRNIVLLFLVQNLPLIVPTASLGLPQVLADELRSLRNLPFEKPLFALGS